MPTTIHIAVAAQTPIYLPLYVADAHGFYGKVPRDFNLDVKPPPDNVHDADAWVHGQVARQEALFGICDPYKAFRKRTTKVIGALVTKAAFWGIDTDVRIDHLTDAHRFERIVAFPRGMTGYLLWQLTQEEGKKTKPNWTPKYVKAEVGREAKEFEKQRHAHKTLVITPDLFGFLKLQCSVDPQIQPKIYYARHVRYGDLFLTGVITRNDVIRNELPAVGEKGYKLAFGLMAALQLAVIDIKRRPEDAIDPLLAGLEKPKTDENRTVAKRVVDQMIQDCIFPDDLTVSPSAWATSVHYHRKALNPRASEPTDKEVAKWMNDDVDRTIAEKAFRELVLQRVELGTLGVRRLWGSAALGLVLLTAFLALIAKLPWVLLPSLIIVAFYVVASAVILIQVLDERIFGSSRWWKAFVPSIVTFVTFYVGVIAFFGKTTNDFLTPHWFPIAAVATVIGCFFARKGLVGVYNRFIERGA